jgi:radical SAM protein with 4Fe4S-binding SPASM domain
MYALDEIPADVATFRQAVNERQPYRPLYVKLKVMFACNLRCEMCNHWRENQPPPLSIERFKEILDELACLGCRKVHLSGGEPLLRPRLPELVEHAASLGLRATMTTNGTRVDKALARQLIISGLRSVNISIDSPDRKIHDRMRGVDGAWKKACRAVGYFRRYAHKGKITIRINTVVSRTNYASLAGLPDFAKELGADFINLIPVDGHCNQSLLLHRSQIQEYNASIAPQIAEHGLTLSLIEDESQAYPFGRSPQALKRARKGEYALGWYERHPCFAPWTHSLIDFNGHVYPCCMTRGRMTPVGDVSQESFNQVWSSEAYKSVRQQMLPPTLPACRHCDDFLHENCQLLETLVSSHQPIEA